MSKIEAQVPLCLLGKQKRHSLRLNQSSIFQLLKISLVLPSLDYQFSTLASPPNFFSQEFCTLFPFKLPASYLFSQTKTTLLHRDQMCDPSLGITSLLRIPFNLPFAAFHIYKPLIPANTTSFYRFSFFFLASLVYSCYPASTSQTLVCILLSVLAGANAVEILL